MANEAMQFRRMGQSGLRLSALSLGGWTTFGSSIDDAALAERIIARAVDAGVNFFDIADVYARGEAERAMGKVLARYPRTNLVISSKVYWPMSDDVNDRGLSRKHIVESVEKSLRRIGTDYLDLYFCHRFDSECALSETVRAMDDLVRAGKILYWGTSEWTGAQLREAHALAAKHNAYGPAVEQPQYNLLARTNVEADVGPSARALGMGLVVWSPLASGVLTGKYDNGIPAGSRLDRIEWLRKHLSDDNLAKTRRFAGLAQELDATRGSVALAWLLKKADVSSVIMGATSLEQLEQNLSALDLKLSDEVVAKLDALFAPAVVAG